MSRSCALVTASCLLATGIAHADDETASDYDEHVDQPIETKRANEPTRRSLALSVAGVGGVYLGLYGWVTAAWYLRSNNSDTFHFHNEGWFGRNTYAGGADKLGHAWGNYAVTRGVSQILQYGGWGKRGSVVTAGALSLAFFTLSEIKDGYEVAYGFSYGDEIANTLGAAFGMLMELSPELDRRIDFRISYLPSGDYLNRLPQDGPFNTPEDYTGQTMLLAYHLGSIETLERHSKWFRYVDVTLGYQARNYLPMPADGSARSQELFVGASLNLQGVFDSAIKSSPGAGILHYVTEMYQVPYTTLRVGQVDRSSPQMPAP